MLAEQVRFGAKKVQIGTAFPAWPASRSNSGPAHPAWWSDFGLAAPPGVVGTGPHVQYTLTLTPREAENQKGPKFFGVFGKTATAGGDAHGCCLTDCTPFTVPVSQGLTRNKQQRSLYYVYYYI